MNNMHFQDRIKALQKKIKQPVLMGSLESFSSNLYYYSGVEESPAIALVTRDEAFLFSWNERDYFQNYGLKDFRKQFFNLLKEKKVKKLGLDEKSDASRFVFRLLKNKINVLPCYSELYAPREIKSEAEQKLMRHAQNVTKNVVAESFEHRNGKTENHFAGLLEEKARKHDLVMNAFPPIVAVNENAAIPHHNPSMKTIGKQDLLLVDCGATNKRYCADYTITFYEGKNKLWKDALHAVDESRKAAARKIKPGVKGSTLSEEALRVLAEYGFKENTFRDIGLSLGHQLGLEVHEGLQGLEKTVLRKGMAITIEPGLYFKKEFGIRFEDVYFVK